MIPMIKANTPLTEKTLSPILEKTVVSGLTMNGLTIAPIESIAMYTPIFLVTRYQYSELPNFNFYRRSGKVMGLKWDINNSGGTG